MKIPGLAAFALLVSVASLDAQAPPCKGESALVHVDSISFFLTAPPGWTLDCAAGKNDGPLVVLYRTGESWQSGAAVMYANVLSLDAAGGAAFRARIRAEAAAWTADVPDAQVAEGRSLRTNAGAISRGSSSAGSRACMRSWRTFPVAARSLSWF